MNPAASQYLSRTGNRDRVLAVVQFLPMLLDGPLLALGKKDLHDSLTQLGAVVDTYRTFTRFSGVLDVVTTDKVNSIRSAQGTPKYLALLEFLSTAAFFPFENFAFLSKHGVWKAAAGTRFGPIAVFFWFWSLVFGEIKTLQEMLLAYPSLTPRATDAGSVKRQAEWKRLVLRAIKTTSFLLFAWSCFPATKPQLLAKPSGVLVPLHRAIELLSPRPLPLSVSARGALGLIASLCDFA